MSKKGTVIKYLDNLIELSLYSFIFMVPFSKTGIEISVVIGLIGWVLKKCLIFQKKSGLKSPLEWLKMLTPESTPLNLPIIVFIITGFFSAIFGASFALGAEGFFFKLLEWIIIYFLVVESVKSTKILYRILSVMLFCIILTASDAVFQLITGVDFIRHYEMSSYRLRGPFGNPNSLAGWLIVMLPLVLSLAIYANTFKSELQKKFNQVGKFIKPLLWFIAVILIICLTLTYSRGAWIAIIISLLAAAFLFKSKRLAIFLVIVTLTIPFVIPEPMKVRLFRVFNTAELKINRPYVWREAISIIEDFPLLGSGLATYAAIGPFYIVSSGTGYYPHNSYLHMAAESGLLGLTAFLWIIIRLFRVSLSSLKIMKEGLNYWVLAGLLVGLFGFLLHSVVDVNIFTLQLGNMMWFIMGLIIVIQKELLKQ